MFVGRGQIHYTQDAVIDFTNQASEELWGRMILLDEVWKYQDLLSWQGCSKECLNNDIMEQRASDKSLSQFNA